MENTQEVVKQEQDMTNPAAESGETTQVADTGGVEETNRKVTGLAGDRTDSNLLLKSLREERERRRRLEAELETFKSSSQTDSYSDSYEDDGELKKQVLSLNEKIARLEERDELNRVYATFPDVKELSTEFDEFRKDYPRHKLENVAKIFRAEKGLIEQTRKGLERTTGGDKNPSPVGMTAEDIANLRATNFKKYQDMVIKGQIKLQSQKAK